MCWISISRTSASPIVGLMVSLAWARNFSEAARNAALSRCASSIMSRSALRTAGRSVWNCRTAFWKSAISSRSYSKKSLRRWASASVSSIGQRIASSRFWIRTAVIESSKMMVILRIAGPLLFLDLLVEIILLVLALPVAKGHAQGIEQRSVDVTSPLGGRFEFVFGDEDEVLLTRTGLQQVLERLSDHRFSGSAGILPQVVQLVPKFRDKDLAHD